MIRSFRHKGLRKLYEDGDRSKIRPDLMEKVERILARLDEASSVEHMALPGFKLHSLKGGLKNFWAVSVSGNWRIIFRFNAGDAFDVDLMDYH